MSDRAFESDAAYFDLVARLSKDPADQAELRKVAEVYRSLAKHGLPGRSPLFMKSRADLWRDRAEECRAIALVLTDPRLKAEYQKLADDYLKLAASEEKLRRT